MVNPQFGDVAGHYVPGWTAAIAARQYKNCYLLVDYGVSGVPHQHIDLLDHSISATTENSN